MPSNALKTDLATRYNAIALYASLHTADPGTTGTSEVAGGAYARVAVSWGAVTNGVVSGTATVNVPVSTTVTHAGLWSASSAGTFYDKATAAYASQTSAGTLAVTFTLTVS